MRGPRVSVGAAIRCKTACLLSPSTSTHTLPIFLTWRCRGSCNLMNMAGEVACCAGTSIQNSQCHRQAFTKPWHTKPKQRHYSTSISHCPSGHKLFVGYPRQGGLPIENQCPPSWAPTPIPLLVLILSSRSQGVFILNFKLSALSPTMHTKLSRHLLQRG